MKVGFQRRAKWVHNTFQFWKWYVLILPTQIMSCINRLIMNSLLGQIHGYIFEWALNPWKVKFGFLQDQSSTFLKYIHAERWGLNLLLPTDFYTVWGNHVTFQRRFRWNFFVGCGCVESIISNSAFWFKLNFSTWNGCRRDEKLEAELAIRDWA